MSLTPKAIALALEEWQRAPHKARTATAERLAAHLGVSRSALYRAFRSAGFRGPSRDRRARLEDEQTQTPDAKRYRERRAWAEVLIALVNKAPDGSLPLDLCLSAAVRDGLLPAEAAEVRVGEYARLIKGAGYRVPGKRTRRLSADYPMQAVQFDASTSKHFRILKRLPDGDRLLELYTNPDPASGYKNKPLGPDRERLVLYGQWDMNSGARHIRPVAALGEAGIDAMAYLVDSWASDGQDWWEGKPTDLWCDNGPLIKHQATLDLLERLEINPERGKPYQHTRQGGIESGWATLWRRFEGQFFLRRQGRERWTITLSDYTAELLGYLAEQNEKVSRCDPALTRREAWLRGTIARGGIRPCPADALETLASEIYRVLDSSGIFSWDNVEYEVPRYFSRRIIARRALDGSGRVIVEIPESGERLEAAPHKPLGYGKWNGQSPATPAERAQAHGAELVAPTALYSESGARLAAGETAGTGSDTRPDSRVVQLGARRRTQPDELLPDPLAVTTRHPTLADAMAAFRGLYSGPLDEANRMLVEQALLGAELDRTAVRDLALQLAALHAGDPASHKPTLTVV